MILYRLKKNIEKALKKNLLSRQGPEKLLKACSYALLSNGKRLRPIIVLMIAKSLGKHDVMPAALSMEFFHTASLIADDLPSMDNEKERRDKPTLHIAFDETTALLTSYSLITWGYEMIAANGRIMQNSGLNSEEVVLLALEEAAACAGLNGAIGGQYNDIYFSDKTIQKAQTIMVQKTASFFEGAFALGWLFGGGPVERLGSVKKCAYHLGLAFQIADDIQDVDEDEEKINIAQLMGITPAKKELENHLNLSKELLSDLGLMGPSFQEALSLIQKTL